ncbi:MAG: phage integrase N-terminal SAM-like domain-containing protein [Rhodoblastus sp.]
MKRILDHLPPSYRPKGWGKEFITLSTGTADRRKGDIEFLRMSKEVEERFALLRAGVRTLSQKETVALAGTIYRAFAEGLEDNPGTADRWEKVLLANVAARAGKYGKGPLLIGGEARRRASMEDRFGPLVDATLARECLLIDTASRDRLMEEIALALDQAALKLRKNAEGDYRPDDVADRFPSWERNTVSSVEGRKLMLGSLFSRWADHPEQEGQAARTISRYRSVFDALDQFLKRPNVHDIKTDDIRRYTDALMTQEKLSPRTVRDVHRAAISSVFNWAIGKRIVQSNPASGVTIKVSKPPHVRPKDLTNDEAQSLTKACLAITRTAAPRSIEAARRWCPLICLYTGARIGEVTQLRKQDIRRHGDLHVIRITPEAGTVKTGQFRDVPIHPRLIELGFLSFVGEADDGPLFFNVSNRRKSDAKTPISELVARELAQWARETCIKDPNLKKPLHAIRHRFMTVARRAGIDQQYAEAITGHAPVGQSRQYGQYDIETLAREIRKLTSNLVEGAD